MGFKKSIFTQWKSIKLIDRYLIVIMCFLMAYSIATVFIGTPMVAQDIANSCDVVVRTTIASIFGYFISSNFAKRETRFNLPEEEAVDYTSSDSTPQIKPNQIQSTTATSKIGFAPDDPSSPSTDPLALPASSYNLTTNNNPPQQSTQLGRNNCLQINIIGSLCILTLLILVVTRFFTTADARVVATLTQFRDIICGSIGFLIGMPSDKG